MLRGFTAISLWFAMVLLAAHVYGDVEVATGDLAVPAGEAAIAPPWFEFLTPRVVGVTLILTAISAFFSASEVAYFSLHKLRLRSMRNSANLLERLVGRLMAHPGNLLTSILMGNSIVNVLLSVVLAVPVEKVFSESLALAPPISYTASLFICTSVLVFFGEILPKVVVVRLSEAYARGAAVPLFVIDRLLTPVRNGIIYFIGIIFRVTRFSQVRPAPFVTDEEFLSLLSEGEASGAIEKDEREMIQGILEFGEVVVREVLVPRPDMIALPETATIGDALELVRNEEYSRMPVYTDDLDHIAGILYAKDLLPAVEDGGLDQPIQSLIRPAHFVPETMTVAEFVKASQRKHTHLAIVVDEFGGTEGLVTLQDALREVVGDLGEPDEEEEPSVLAVNDREYLIDGGMPLYEFEELTGITVDNGEHNTVAGFLMEQADRLLETGDRIEHQGVEFQVESVDGRRVERLRIQLPEPTVEETAP